MNVAARAASLAILVILFVAAGSLAEEPAAAGIGRSAASPGDVAPTDGGTDSMYGPIEYDPSGNIMAIGPSYYLYDPLSRVTAASVDRFGHSQTQTYTYDAYGNRLSDGTSTYSASAATNRLTSFAAQYDARGNMTSWQPEGSIVARTRKKWGQSFDPQFCKKWGQSFDPQFCEAVIGARASILNSEAATRRRDAISGQRVREFADVGEVGPPISRHCQDGRANPCRV